MSSIDRSVKRPFTKSMFQRALQSELVMPYPPRQLRSLEINDDRVV